MRRYRMGSEEKGEHKEQQGKGLFTEREVLYGKSRIDGTPE